jgi:cytochrome c-type biogenesis protein CcmE
MTDKHSEEKLAVETTTSWEKPTRRDRQLEQLTRSRGRWKFLVGGLMILASVTYLVISSTLTDARFFITVDDLTTSSEYIGETVRLTGAVLGDTINHSIDRDPGSNRTTSTITFTISHLPTRTENLAEALYHSVNDPGRSRIDIYYEGPRPDLLQHEAQAIVTGTLGEDGVFYANELQFKCPSRFEEGGSSDLLGDDHPGMQFNAG